MVLSHFVEEFLLLDRRSPLVEHVVLSQLLLWLGVDLHRVLFLVKMFLFVRNLTLALFGHGDDLVLVDHVGVHILV
jgi:hypothetical protein